MKVKGVIQWVNAKDCVDLKLHEFDYLLLDGDGDFNDRLTPDSHKVYPDAKGEAALKDAKITMPKWVSFDTATLVGKILENPKREDVDANITESLIIEKYSK